MNAFRQLGFLAYEISNLNNRRWWRWLTCYFATGFWIILTYRINRALFLLMGAKVFVTVKIALSPALFVLRPWLGSHEIHYRADVGKGLKILHPTLGIVISAHTIAGEHLTLTGGNCIGGRRAMQHGDIILGNHVTLGANAVILGPVRIGDRVRIGAGAVVIRDADDGAVLVGVPAAPLAGRRRVGDQEIA